jgi:hypothetical protein
MLTLIVHGNKVHHVITINRVAQDRGEDEDWLAPRHGDYDWLMRPSTGDTRTILLGGNQRLFCN